MSFYFRVDGTPNVAKIARVTAAFVSAYVVTFCAGVQKDRDNALQASSAQYVQYSKLKPESMSELHGRLIAITHPNRPNEVIFRRLVGSELLWVRRKDDGGVA